MQTQSSLQSLCHDAMKIELNASHDLSLTKVNNQFLAELVKPEAPKPKEKQQQLRIMLRENSTGSQKIWKQLKKKKAKTGAFAPRSIKSIEKKGLANFEKQEVCFSSIVP